MCKLARLLSKLGSFEWTRPSTNDKQTSLKMRIMMREGEDDVCTGIGTILQLLNFRKFFIRLLLLTEEWKQSYNSNFQLLSSNNNNNNVL